MLGVMYLTWHVSLDQCPPRAHQATISPNEQMRIVLEALTEFIERKVA